MIKILTAILSALLVSSCADTHQIIRQNSDVPSKLNSKDSFYVAVPSDGAYGSDVYFGSGQNTAQIVFSAISKHTNSVKVAREVQSYENAHSSAVKSGAKYLVYPTILSWEDRATEWSGIPDKVEVKIEIIETATDKTISSAIVKGKSGLATFGGDHPQDLLPEPMQEYISSNF